MKKIGITLLFVLATSVTFAQKFKGEKGNISVLKGQSVVNIEFDYSNLKLLKENLTEAQYIQNRKGDLNAKNNGEGDLWEKKWNSAKEVFWEPKFQELLLKTVTKDKKVAFKENATDAKYTLIVEAVWIYPGWDAAVMKQPAKVTTVLKIVETANRSNVLYEVRAENAPGDQWGNNFSNESRIGEGFAKTAKSFGKLLTKKL